LHSSNLISVSV